MNIIQQHFNCFNLQTKTIESAEEQEQLSEEIKYVVETQSKEMKSEDLKKLTHVIENLLQFEDLLLVDPTFQVKDSMIGPINSVSIRIN